MKRGAILLVCLGVLFFLTSGPGATEQSSLDSLCIPMGNIEIGAPDNVEAKRPSVFFPHSQHFGYNCVECHHTWEKTDDITSCMTSGCHDLTQMQEKDSLKARYFKSAFHDKCIGCHKAIKSKNQADAASGKILKDKLKEVGPTSCKGCHSES